MKKTLTEAVALGNATSRSVFMNPRDRNWYYYPNSNWQNMLFATGYEFSDGAIGPLQRLFTDFTAYEGRQAMQDVVGDDRDISHGWREMIVFDIRLLA
jgi:hypothetical protein